MRLMNAAETVFHGWYNLVPRARVHFRLAAATRPFCFLGADQKERSPVERDCSCYCPGDIALRMRKVLAIPLSCVVLALHSDVLDSLMFFFFFVRTSSFGAEAERSYLSYLSNSLNKISFSE